MHFFEIGSIYTFSILELLKLPKIAQISTPVQLYCAFLVGGKMAVILAVVMPVVMFQQTGHDSSTGLASKLRPFFWPT